MCLMNRLRVILIAGLTMPGVFACDPDDERGEKSKATGKADNTGDSENCETNEDCPEGEQCIQNAFAEDLATCFPIPEPIPCWDHGGCQSGEYCDFGSACSGPGVCALRPFFECPSDDSPVCGCDGITYNSLCDSAANAASVASDGVCSEVSACTSDDDCPEGQSCVASSFAMNHNTCVPIPEPIVCTSHADCESWSYCDFGPACEGEGICALRPFFECPANGTAVCGCDGATYESLCEAAANAVSVAHDDAC
jgi:hypothetical protein